MTIDFATIHTALADEILTAATGVTTDVRWDWQPSTMRQPTRVTLSRTPIEIIGRDGSSFDLDDADDLIERRFGQRSFRVEIRVESIAGSPTATPYAADDLLARIMSRIRRRAAVQALYDAGCSITDISPIVRSTYSADGIRETRAAIMSIGFLAADVEQVTTAGQSEDRIETVEGEMLGDPFTAP